MKVIQAKSAGFCYGVQRGELAGRPRVSAAGYVMSLEHHPPTRHVVQHWSSSARIRSRGRRKSARATRYSSAPTARKSRSLAT